MRLDKVIAAPASDTISGMIRALERLRVFVTKTEKTPTGEIDLALQRAKEVKP